MHSPIKGCTVAVELVDVDDARYSVVVRLPPDFFCLRFYTRHAIQDTYCPVKHAKRADDFKREIGVAGCIDQVNGVLFF